MWQCGNCRESVDDPFEVCWNCGTSRDGTVDHGFRRAEDFVPGDEGERPFSGPAPAEVPATPSLVPIQCPVCSEQMIVGRFEVWPTVASMVSDAVSVVGVMVAAALSGSPSVLFSGGASTAQLFFDDNGKSDVAVPQSAEGYYCRTCHTSLVPGTGRAEPGVAAARGGR